MYVNPDAKPIISNGTTVSGGSFKIKEVDAVDGNFNPIKATEFYDTQTNRLVRVISSQVDGSIEERNISYDDDGKISKVSCRIKETDGSVHFSEEDYSYNLEDKSNERTYKEFDQDGKITHYSTTLTTSNGITFTADGGPQTEIIDLY